MYGTVDKREQAWWNWSPAASRCDYVRFDINKLLTPFE
jgi:hypothetical protein